MAYYEDIDLFVTSHRNHADVINEPLQKIIENIKDTRSLIKDATDYLDTLEKTFADYTKTEDLNELLSKGIKGDKGDTGEGLEYNWDGTALGVKMESEQDFVYRELKGEPGDVSLEQLEQAIQESKTELENEITNIPKVTKTSELTNDSGFITANDIPDVDLEPYALKTQIPTSLPASDVYAWAKASTKPTYTASEVGALPSNGTATSASKVEKALTLQIGGTTKNTFNGSSAQTFNIPNASTSASGVMTKDMVSKLNGIATGATKNTVDTAMSSTSTNAVQNKVIYAYVQEQLNNLANGGISVIKSIQRGVSTIENGDSSCYITINEVNVNKTMVNYLGFSSADSNDTSSDHRYRCYIRLVDSTTIGIRRARSDGDYIYSWEVIEFY